MSALDRVQREVQRGAQRGRNGSRMVADNAPPGVGQTPKEVMRRSGRSALGLTGRALLRDHIRARNRELHDLVMLPHFADAA